MTPTHEQYELAAKAAGYKIGWEDRDGEECPTLGGLWWEPTTDKSDSFDLMVACDIELKYWGGAISATKDDSFFQRVFHNDNDKGLATMWAVFLCAVEIGRAM